MTTIDKEAFELRRTTIADLLASIRTQLPASPATDVIDSLVVAGELKLAAEELIAAARAYVATPPSGFWEQMSRVAKEMDITDSMLSDAP